MELRLVLRNGEKILQIEKKEYYGEPYYDALRRRVHPKRSVWVDVPLCAEETGEELIETRDTNGDVNGWKFKETGIKYNRHAFLLHPSNGN